ncbi:MAG TPA: hypothetical protein VGJ21_08125 [Terracidiphilus sp.]|jgi:hypothetical protein
MKHLTEEELVEMYYGTDEGRADVHLRECTECAAAFRVLESDLAAMRPLNVPERSPHYAEQMWSRVEGALPPHRTRQASTRRVAFWRTLAYAAGCAVLVAGAFYGGRVYEHQEHLKRVQERAAAHPATAVPKVVVVVLGDHLDRSERLLVQLKHADAESPELVNPLRQEARELLAANHVFRDDAEKEGDAALTEALSRLDKLLTEVANQPGGGLDAASLDRIRTEMNAEGLLFEVRVLRSKNPHRTKTVRLVAKGGTA